jgi:hypothetical protein
MHNAGRVARSFSPGHPMKGALARVKEDLALKRKHEAVVNNRIARVPNVNLELLAVPSRLWMRQMFKQLAVTSSMIVAIARGSHVPHVAMHSRQAQSCGLWASESSNISSWRILLVSSSVIACLRTSPARRVRKCALAGSSIRAEFLRRSFPQTRSTDSPDSQ